MKLDEEEAEILAAFDRGELVPIANRAIELQRHKDHATATLKKYKPVGGDGRSTTA
jgi:hypothetical protein